LDASNCRISVGDSVADNRTLIIIAKALSVPRKHSKNFGRGTIHKNTTCTRERTQGGTDKGSTWLQRIQREGA
jgi:hypothetical protein